MKHPQHIVAFRKASFPLPPGISPINISEFIDAATGALFIGRRHELENNDEFGQALPYIVVRQGGHVFSYRRTKMVGEERLIGMRSIGIGGHVDLTDVRYSIDSVINVVTTFAGAIARELEEELQFNDPEGAALTFAQLGIVPTVIGMINDTSDPVGQVHYGILLLLDLPHGFTCRVKEEELQGEGFIDPATIEGCESWTKLTIEYLKK